MFLIDGPYVSDFLKQTLETCNIPVIKTARSQAYLKDYQITYLDDQEAQAFLLDNPEQLVYTNSENALDWLYEKTPWSDLVKRVQLVKDKIQFREALKQLHPNYYFKSCPSSGLSTLDAEKIPFPVILKPAVGFFSLGVERIEDGDHWRRTMSVLDSQIRSSDSIYPKGVLDHSNFIIEAVIPGDEFAIDCYFDESGSPVILNMMKHWFASQSDMNDRVYLTSGIVVQRHISQIQSYLDQLGATFDLRNFPAHVELRISGPGDVNVIEINPLRFGGWCTTADMAQYAWGTNLYQGVLEGMRPDWSVLTTKDPDQVYALIVLNNSTGIQGKHIQGFDYEALLKKFSEPLELRKTDFSRFPLFGFVMCKVKPENLDELDFILHSDLREFVKS